MMSKRLGKNESMLDWVIFSVKFGLEEVLSWLEFRADKEHMWHLI